MKEKEVVIKLRYRKVLRLPESMYKVFLKQKEYGNALTCLLCVEATTMGVKGDCKVCRFPPYPKDSSHTFPCMAWIYNIMGSRKNSAIRKALKDRRIK